MNSLIKALSIGASRFAQQPKTPWKQGTAQPSTTGIRNWLILGTGYSSVYRNTSSEIVVECIDDSWAEANGSDLIANREAALESLQPRQHKAYSNRSVAWPLVTSYYSAYFAVQSFLRCLGLEPEEIDLITAAWHFRGFPISLTAGNYGFSIELSVPTKIVLRKMGSSGGAHHQFWTGFRQSQSAIHHVLLLSPGLNTLSTTERQAADGDYVKLVRVTTSSGLPSSATR
jgi:hypothetical protein